MNKSKTIQDINVETDWSMLERPLSQHSIYSKAVKLIKAIPKGKLLEIGAANDSFLRYCQGLGWDVQGIDIQERESELIMKHDVSEPLPFKTKFDCIVTLEVIEHIVDTRYFLDNIANHLNDGGYLILSTPNLLFWVNRLLMLLGKKPVLCYADFHVRMFVWSDLKKKIASRFDILKLIGSHMLVGPWYSKWAIIFSVFGSMFPTLSAHLIVVAQKTK